MSDRPLIAVLERNRAVSSKIARVMAAASNGGEVVADEDPAALASRLERSPDLLAFDERDLDVARGWLKDRMRSARLVCWTQESTADLLKEASREPRLDAIIGWPSFRSTPRLQEIAHATRRALGDAPGGPRLGELLHWGGSVSTWTPRTSEQRDAAVEAVTILAERLGISGRVLARAGEAAHELLMNAMYDAPVDATGRPVFALDRTQRVELPEAWAPTLRFACDGVTLGLQVTDPFGRLHRRTVLQSILRGLSASSSTRAEDALDTSHGGAGLGLLKLYTSSAALFVDVVSGRSTRVTWLYDLEVSQRDQRSLPATLQIFEQAPPYREEAR